MAVAAAAIARPLLHGLGRDPVLASAFLGGLLPLGSAVGLRLFASRLATLRDLGEGPPAREWPARPDSNR